MSAPVIQIKRSTVALATPASLLAGELAINTTDQAFYVGTGTTPIKFTPLGEVDTSEMLAIRDAVLEIKADVLEAKDDVLALVDTAEASATGASASATTATIAAINVGSMLGINFGSWSVVDGELIITHLSTTSPSLNNGDLILTYETL